MCVGSWSKMGYIQDKDVKVITVLPEVDDDEALEEGWDKI
jgi:hypothetical protein